MELLDCVLIHTAFCIQIYAFPSSSVAVHRVRVCRSRTPVTFKHYLLNVQLGPDHHDQLCPFHLFHSLGALWIVLIIETIYPLYV